MRSLARTLVPPVGRQSENRWIASVNQKKASGAAHAQIASVPAPHE